MEIYSEAPLVVNEDSRMFLTLDDFAKLRRKVLFPVPGPWMVRPYKLCTRADGWVELIFYDVWLTKHNRMDLIWTR